MAKQPAKTPANQKATPKRDQSGFYKVVGLVVAVAAVALIYQFTKPSDQGATKLDPSVPLPEAKGYTIGKPDAPVKVIEFADFECPACGQFATLTEPDVRTRLVDSGLVQYTYMDYPLPMHQNTWAASNAAACADEQGKFWEMHDLLFAQQDQWNGFATKRPGGKMKEYAGQLGLDVDKWEKCFDAQTYLPNIKARELEAQKQGAQQTPTFRIGSRLVPGSVAFDKFRAYVDTALAEAKAAAPAAPAADTAKK